MDGDTRTPLMRAVSPYFLNPKLKSWSCKLQNGFCKECEAEHRLLTTNHTSELRNCPKLECERRLIKLPLSSLDVFIDEEMPCKLVKSFCMLRDHVKGSSKFDNRSSEFDDKCPQCGDTSLIVLKSWEVGQGVQITQYKDSNGHSFRVYATHKASRTFNTDGKHYCSMCNTFHDDSILKRDKVGRLNCPYTRKLVKHPTICVTHS